MISQRAWLIGGVGFCFYLIAIVNTLASFYYALTWLAVGVLASSLGIALLSLIGLRCAWQTPDAILSQEIGADEHEIAPHVEIQFANGGTLNKTGILIEVHLAREADGKKQNIVRRYLLEALPSGQSVQSQLPLTHLPRGRYCVEEIHLYGSDVLGLFRIRKRVPRGLALDASGALLQNESSSPVVDGEIVIGPAALTYGDTARSIATSPGESGSPATRALGQGDEMRGTRMYAPGDDLRHVHWKSVARKGQLVVKEFHHTQESRILIVWDGARHTDWGEKAKHSFHAGNGLPRTTTEWSLCLTASLCRALAERRQPSTLLRLSAQPVCVGAADSAQPNARGAQSNGDATFSMTQVLKVLSEAESDHDGSLLKAVRAASQTTFAQSSAYSSSGGEIFFVTASLAPDAIRAVRQWRVMGARIHVALFDGAAFRDAAKNSDRAKPEFQTWEPSTAAGGSPAEEARAAVTSENYQAQARALREAGAHVVVVAPREGEKDALTIKSALLALLQNESAREQALPFSQPEKTAAL